MQIRMIGVDLAKHVFQVHGSDAEGNCLVKRRLRRNQMLKFFAGLATLPSRHGSLCHGSLLGARNADARA